MKKSSNTSKSVETKPFNVKDTDLEKMVDNIKECEKVAEVIKKPKTTHLKYRFKFGLYKDLLARDVLKIEECDIDNSRKQIGRSYIEFLVGSECLNPSDRNILKRVLLL